MSSVELEVQRADAKSPDPTELREKLERQGLSFYRWSNGPGYEYGAHQHGYHKVILVERGSIIFHLPDRNRSIELIAGDRLQLPAGIVHAATVGSNGVACLEAHIQ